MACFKGCIPASCLQLGYFFKMMNRLVKAGAHKKTPAQVQSIERQTWTEPSADAISTGSKVLWGYWHMGRENLPPFCELCVRTWEARHPGWTVVILSDSSFKTYVSPSDLPSTFESLKVQHRSDIVRFAVLRRYGGVYLDVSTVCMKSFNDIWENPGDAEVMLAMPGWLDCGTKIVNNAIIMALKPHTPYIRRLQQRVLSYAESPCTTLEEMEGHSAFGEWRRHFDDPGMGLIADMMEYAAILWIMADCLVYDKEVRSYVEQHVRALPTFTWTHDFLCLPEPPQDGKDTWQIGFLVKQFWKYAPILFRDDPKAFESISDRVNVFKVSTLFATDWEKPMAWHLGNKTTMGRVLLHATDPATVMQATLDGTYPIPLPNNTVVSDEPRDATHGV